MTAEEYLDEKKREHYYPGHTYYYVSLEEALKAVEMARNEGREETKQKQPASEMRAHTDLFRQVAIAALQGCISNPSSIDSHISDISNFALEQAEDFIRALDKWKH